MPKRPEADTGKRDQVASSSAPRSDLIRAQETAQRSEKARTIRAQALRHAALRGADLVEANLVGANLRRANLADSDMTGARLRGADLTEATLDGAELLGAHLNQACLSRAGLRGANLSAAVLRKAVLLDADLSYANLQKIDARSADFSRARLAGADLRGANLVGAKMLHVDFRGARYDKKTRWPSEFRLLEEGLIFSDEDEHTVEFTTLRPGRPHPLGATWDGQGVNFALFAEHAKHVELCLFDAPKATRASARILMPEQTDGIWHVYVPHLTPGQLYGYRVHGPYEPKGGLRFNPNKLLLDPYARAISGDVKWHDALFGYRVGDTESVTFDRRNSAAYMPKSVVVDTSFPWEDDKPPRTPWHRSVVYELHVKGFSKLHPGIPESMQGTYSALGTPLIIDYLKSLGVTAVELLPVHYHVDDRFLVERGLTNYWGYNTLNYFAPNSRYSRDRTPGSEVREFKAMVKALHAAGIEVILDVVYNHTAEGNHLGPTLSYRGIDNQSYYRLVPDDSRYYMDYTGCGNTLNVLNSRTLQLLMDSLRYWVCEMHVDGFRFDLAAALMRGLHEADRLSAFFDVITQDPVISQVKLIAEPWDVGPGGYQVGNFPPMWTEWNGRYRDTLRRFWKGDESQVGELAYRLSGSSDLYEHNGRRPYASINFVTAHDGFTLRDLVSYNDRHNEANGEDNRDGCSHNDSWNCGEEGPTADPDIQVLRARQMRNLMASLLLSQGVPMLVAGDERGRTQHGNNNAYCQDNSLSWVDWSTSNEGKNLLDFTRYIAGLRQLHPVLRRRRFFFGRKVHGAEIRDIMWLRPDGGEMNEDEWSAGYLRCLGMLLNGRVMGEWGEEGQLVHDDILLILLNAHHEAVEFCVPDIGKSDEWELVVDTVYQVKPPPASLKPGEKYPVQGRSLVLLSSS